MRQSFRTKVVHFDQLKKCPPGTSLPQMSNHDQSSQDDTWQTVPASLAPPNTNLELLDIDDHHLLFSLQCLPDTLNVTTDAPH